MGNTELFHFLIELIWSAFGWAGYWAISSPPAPSEGGGDWTGIILLLGYWLLVIGILDFSPDSYRD